MDAANTARNQEGASSAFHAGHCYASSCGRVTLYLGDSLAIAPTLQGVDAVVTDPPYPDYLAEEYGYHDGILAPLESMLCRQIIFWSAKADFPIDYSAIHIWDKWIGAGSQYERIFERNGGKEYKVFKYAAVGNPFRAQIAKDIHADHPSQKPIMLMKKLVEKYTKENATVLDPWMGSGSTGVACVGTGRRFVGIEKDPTHYATALERIKRELSQGDLFHSQHNITLADENEK
jgi:DNA modification methylase